MRLILPLPPSVNAMYRSIGRGRNILSKAGRQWYTEACPLVKQQANGEYFNGKVFVTIHLHFPDRRRTDIDNRSKGVLDAITKSHVWGDDCQVDDLRITRMAVDKANPRCEVTITTL